MKNRLPIMFVLSVLCALTCKAQTATLWGMTSSGGGIEEGCIFYYDIATRTCTNVHGFNWGPTGDNAPTGSLIQGSNGLLYGMTTHGGPSTLPDAGGIIFSYNISTGTFTDIHDFVTDSDGAAPHGSLLQASDGQLYGMTPRGGAYTKGVIFSYNIASGTETVLHHFGSDSSDGSAPYGSLMQANDGLLYGATTEGGINGLGTLFTYNILTNTYTVIHNFGNGADGAYPQECPIQVTDSLLYGTTQGGGDSLQSGFGTIYSYNVLSGSYNIVYDFRINSAGFTPDSGGSSPDGLVKASNGMLYGMCGLGGMINGGGTIFSYDVQNRARTTLHNFGHVPDGTEPTGALIQASDGLLYGMTPTGGRTAEGGPAGKGMLFAYNIALNIYIALFNFGGGTDGAVPVGSLLEVDYPTSIPQLSTNTPLQISPNPTTGRFRVQLPNNQSSYPVEVYNTLGQKVEQLTLSNTQNTINLDNQATGMYFVCVQTETGMQTAKVLVVK